MITSNGLYLDPVIEIIDNSKLRDFKRCPRYGFFKHILGWKFPFPSVDLVFGSAYHAGHEFLGTAGYTKDNVEGAMEAFLDIWREEFSPARDEDFKKKGKTPENARAAYEAYVRKYKDDGLTPLYNEIGIPVPLSENQTLFVKLDRISKRADGKIMIVDFKTSAREVSYWAEQWESSNQFFGYLHGAYCMYPYSEVAGLLVDGTFFYPSSPPKFRRHLIRKTPAQMQDWLINVQWWFSFLQEQLRLLLTESDNDPVMKSFPRNDEGCVKYGRLCPFHAYCWSTPNPLRKWKIPDDVPHEFVVDYWNPEVDPVSYRFEDGKIIRVVKEKKERKDWTLEDEKDKQSNGGGLLSSILGS